MVWLGAALGATILAIGGALMHRAVIARRRDEPALEVDAPPRCWRVLRTASELEEAVARAIAGEEAVLRQCRTRAQRYAAIETDVANVRALSRPNCESIGRG